MVFTSFSFLVFFAAAMAVYFLAPQRWRWAVLLAVSLYFYLSASIRYAVFLLLSALSTYGCGRYLGSCAARQRDYLQTHRGTLSPEEKKQYRAAVGRRKRRVLALTLVLNLGILGFLKYFNFLSDNVGSLIRLFVPEFSPVRLSLALPLGISFYTFQVVGYCLDVYREVTEPQRNFLKYLLFVSFFPQTMQGPIGRYDELAPQLYQGCGFSYRRVCFGLQRMLWGFFEKLVIADRLTMLVDTVFGGWQTYGARHLVVAVVCYAIQIYADFAGYMDIALGAGQVFGIELAENFQQPYFSRGIPEFWRRWHQTLGSWFKDYLFYPVLRAGWCKTLGARLKRRWGKDAAAKATTVLALGIVWFTTGLWHGASWHYIAWGLYYGVLIILSTLFSPALERLSDRLGWNRAKASARLVQMLRTFALVCGGYVLFRSETMTQAAGILWRIATLADADGQTLYTMGLETSDMKLAAAAIAVLLAVDICHARGIRLREQLAAQGLWLRWLVYLAALFAVLVFGVYGPAYDAASFLYFQF